MAVISDVMMTGPKNRDEFEGNSINSEICCINSRKLTSFLGCAKADGDIVFELTKCRWFQCFEINLNFVGIRVTECRFTLLNDLNDFTEFVT